MSLLENHTTTFTSSLGNKGWKCSTPRKSLGLTPHQVDSHRAAETWPGEGRPAPWTAQVATEAGMERPRRGGVAREGGSSRLLPSLGRKSWLVLEISVPHFPHSAFENRDIGCGFPIRFFSSVLNVLFVTLSWAAKLPRSSQSS